MSLARIFALCVALCCGTGCRNKEKAARRDQLIDLKNGNTGDEDIAAAMQKARDTVGDFLAVIQAPGTNQIQFMVRREYPTDIPGKRQILIVNNVTYDGKLLHGTVDDKTVRPGHTIPRNGSVSFPPEEICDWMFNDNGKAAGGYMLRALKKKMTEQEWAGIAAQITFKDE